MKVREIDNITERAAYDEFVSSHPAGHIFQSYEWGEVKKGDGWKPVRMVAEAEGSIRGAVSLLIRKFPFGYSMFYIPRGPVLDFHDTECLDSILSAIRRYAGEQKTVFLQMNPDIPAGADTIKIFNNRGLLPILKWGLFRVTCPKYVFRLDLQKNPEDIFKGFSKGTRADIKLSERKGVSVEKGNDIDSLKHFYAFLKTAGRRKGFMIRSFAYQRRIFIEMAQKGLAQIFLARYQGKYIGARMEFIFGKKCWDMYAGSDPEAYEARPNHMLMWHVIKWAKEQGCIWLDLRGVGAWNIPEHPARGIYKFKKSFNPEFCEFAGDFYEIFRPGPYSYYEKIEFVIQKAANYFIKAKNRLSFVSSERKEKENTLLVLEKYAQKEEVEEYSRQVFDRGLDYEEKIVNRYFVRKGKVLNIGCGAGREAVALAKSGFDVTGVDLQPKMVEAAMKNAEIAGVKIKFSIMDATRLEFPDKSFDYALMLGSILAYIPGRRNRLKALQEAGRILKPGGILIFSVPSRKCSFRHRAYFFVTGLVRGMMKKLNIPSLEPGDRYAFRVSGSGTFSDRKTYFHMFTMAEAIQDLTLAGLSLIDCRSREEIIKGIKLPQKREKDYFMYFTAEMKKEKD